MSKNNGYTTSKKEVEKYIKEFEKYVYPFLQEKQKFEKQEQQNTPVIFVISVDNLIKDLPTFLSNGKELLVDSKIYLTENANYVFVYNKRNKDKEFQEALKELEKNIKYFK